MLKSLRAHEIVGAIVLGVVTGHYIFDEPLKAWAAELRAKRGAPPAAPTPASSPAPPAPAAAAPEK